MRKEVAIAAAGLAAGVVALIALSGSDEPPKKPRAKEPPRPRPPRPPRTPPTSVYDDHRELYAPSVDAPFGPRHGRRKPSGLPLFVATASGSTGRVVIDGLDEDRSRAEAGRAYSQRFGASPSTVRVRRVRRASARGAAVRPVAEQAARHGHGQAFVDTITHLAKTEGEGGTFAVPARNFNAACTSTALNRRRLCTTADAPRGNNTLITAWGVFQWNRDAGRELHALDDLGLNAPPIAPDWMPWDWTAAEEIAVPINYYAQLWALVRRRGGSALDAARGMRLWHTGPSRFRRYLARGADQGAWGTVQTNVSEKIDRHLKNAGVA